MTNRAKTVIKEDLIDGIGPWMWLENDVGAWYGPLADWPKHKALWLSHIKSFRVCVQAGGCLGMYPRLLAEHFQVVHTFEPDPINYSVLTQNCKNKSNIKYYNKGLSDKHQTAMLHICEDGNAGMNQVREDFKVADRAPNAILVSLIPLDSLELDHIDFIQLDCESYEFIVIEGARKTIERCKPAISCEMYFADEAVLLKKMESIGYYPVGRSFNDTLFMHGVRR